jgi:hypothetical protein
MLASLKAAVGDKPKPTAKESIMAKMALSAFGGKPEPRKSISDKPHQNSNWMQVQMLTGSQATATADILDTCPQVHRNPHPATEAEIGAMSKYRALLLKMIIDQCTDDIIHGFLERKLTNVDKRVLKEVMDVQEEAEGPTVAERGNRLSCLINLILHRPYGFAKLMDSLKLKELEEAHDDIETAIQQEHEQRKVLVQLFNQTNGEDWLEKQNWLGATDITTWFGCEKVREYDLPDGSIEITVWKLTILRLTDNNLVGNIPKEIGLLHRLRELWLDNNQLSGNIPASLMDCHQIAEIHFENNKLRGAIPSTIHELRLLEVFNVSNNQLIGSVSPLIGKCERLREFDVHSNRLSGVLPPSIGKLGELKVLNAGYNSFRGAIPPSIGSCAKLEYLRLDHNALDGAIPDSLARCASLSTINLNCNRISGPIPWSLCFYCDQLQEVYIGANCLSGPLPDSIGQCRNLRILSLPSNQLSGKIPDSLAQLPQLQSVCLHPNFFEQTEQAEELLERAYGDKVQFKLGDKESIWEG